MARALVNSVNLKYPYSIFFFYARTGRRIKWRNRLTEVIKIATSAHARPASSESTLFFWAARALEKVTGYQIHKGMNTSCPRMATIVVWSEGG
jgi:hypothetical protein